eukprot:8478549-Alexandrium_andersonii.AAC.1
MNTPAASNTAERANHSTLKLGPVEADDEHTPTAAQARIAPCKLANHATHGVQRTDRKITRWRLVEDCQSFVLPGVAQDVRLAGVHCGPPTAQRSLRQLGTSAGS